MAGYSFADPGPIVTGRAADTALLRSGRATIREPIQGQRPSVVMDSSGDPYQRNPDTDL